MKGKITKCGEILRNGPGIYAFTCAFCNAQFKSTKAIFEHIESLHFMATNAEEDCLESQTTVTESPQQMLLNEIKIEKEEVYEYTEFKETIPPDEYEENYLKVGNNLCAEHYIKSEPDNSATETTQQICLEEIKIEPEDECNNTELVELIPYNEDDQEEGNNATYEYETSTPSEIVEKARNTNYLLPEKSRNKYETTYKNFIQWRSMKEINSMSETVIVSYFKELAKKHKPSSLWSIYSMLKSTIFIEHQINIHDYTGLITFLKCQSEGYQGKQSKILNPEDIRKFLKEAPDNQFLVIKVALIIGVQGACSRQDLCNITLKDVVDYGNMFLIKITDTKNKKPRTFVVNNEFYDICKKYLNLRPKKVTTNKFFLRYHNSKCYKQVIGINMFGSMPKTVATFLKLENADNYTGHTFKRTSATLLANSGTDSLVRPMK